jgi:hypothetical protein
MVRKKGVYFTEGHICFCSSHGTIVLNYTRFDCFKETAFLTKVNVICVIIIVLYGVVFPILRTDGK